MKTRTIATITAVVFLLALLQALLCLLGTYAAMAGGIVLPICSRFLLRFFELDLKRWMFVGIPSLASVLGTSTAVLGLNTPASSPLWLGCAIAALVAFAIEVWEHRRARRCALCDKHITGQSGFVCPRCEFLVCERSCWVFGRLRCRLCEQNGVSLSLIDRKWWDMHFGPPLRTGRCEYCKRTPESVKLRSCGRCGRPQCEACWDDLNGQCQRCQWIVPDLPKQLQALMPVASAAGSSSRS